MSHDNYSSISSENPAYRGRVGVQAVTVKTDTKVRSIASWEDIIPVLLLSASLSLENPREHRVHELCTGPQPQWHSCLGTVTVSAGDDLS